MAGGKPTQRELASIRAVLVACGAADVQLDLALERQAFLRSPRGVVGTLYKHEDGAWIVSLGARGRGQLGFRGVVIGEPRAPVARVLRRALLEIPDPLGPPRSLSAELGERLELVVPALSPRRGARRAAPPGVLVATARDERGAAFTWAPLFSTATRAQVRAAFDVAARALSRTLATRGRTRTRRGLRARVWGRGGGSIALWETDHDPAGGWQLHVGAWAKPAAAALPPW